MNDSANEMEIFLGLPTGADEETLSAYLDQACGDDLELRRGVEKLIAADAGTGLMDKAVMGDVAPLPAEESAEVGSKIIGNYKLLHEIGEGGFGVVYMADQLRPVKRRVALKIIKLGMDTRQVVARFEVERQALAMMDHPNIAKVLDAGATKSGRPYFVMEMVRGIPITRFCVEKKLGTEQRLRLFIDVCRAVQHAHQKGIIHRDLKPSNVMVTTHDDRAIPKVIDFGVAKATQTELTNKTLFTRFEQFIGTPTYMSPEQAEMSGLDIDTRSDIYSLGVLLYELLTDTTPFDSAELAKAGQDEIRRKIREDEPPKPSTRLSEVTKARSRISQSDHANHSALRSDLDWIVMKAMEKDRARRYETANGLAMDIQRYLHDDPVIAAAPSAGYLLGKFVRRNRRAVAVAATIAVILAAGILVIMKQRDAALYSEGLGWLLRAEMAERDGNRYPDTLLYSARAIGFDGLGRPERTFSNLPPRPIRKSSNPGRYQEARNWIRERPNYLPVWSRTRPQSSASITGLAVSPLGRWLASGTENGSVHLQDVAAADVREIEILPASGRPAVSLAFHPGGRLLAVAVSGAIRFWDLEEQAFVGHHESSVATLAYSPKGDLLAGAAADGSIFLWEDEVMTVLKTAQPHEATTLKFSPDGAILAVVFPGVAVNLFFLEETEGRKWLLPLAVWAKIERLEEVTAIAFSPDGCTLAIGSHRGGISLWEVATGKPKGEVVSNESHTRSVLDLGFSHDGKQLASASADGTAKLWFVGDGDLKLKATLVGHDAAVRHVVYAPGGKLLATASAPNHMMLWDVTGRRGEEPNLYRYLENDCFSFNPMTHQVEAHWQPDVGFVNLPSESVMDVWQRGKGPSDSLFRCLFGAQNWSAAELVAESEGDERRQLAAQLLIEAKAAAADRRWILARLRLSQWARLDGVGEEVAAKIEQACPAREGVSFKNGEGIDLVWCEKGSFTMGSPEGQRTRKPNETQHDVTLTSGFWIGKYELTQAQFQEVMGFNPSAHPNPPHDADEETKRNWRKIAPAENMSWEEAVQFCHLLTERERARGAIPSGWEYHLPTEAQWEYACRAGSSAAYCFGDNENELGEYAWYSINSDRRPKPVGQLKPNVWGIYDMHGNAWEWCRDASTMADYEEGSVEDPLGTHGKEKVVRGGRAGGSAQACRSAHRGMDMPKDRYDVEGFRPVLVPIRRGSGTTSSGKHWDRLK